MNISSTSHIAPVIAPAEQTAVEGIRSQEQRLERNITEVSASEDTQAQSSGFQGEALVEQQEIVQAVQANARSLEAANERIGTLIDTTI